MRARHKGGQSRNYPEVRPTRGAHTEGMTRASHGQPGFSKRRNPDLLDEDILSVPGLWAGHGPHIELCRAAIFGNASCALDPSAMTEVPTPNGDFEEGTIDNWSGAVLAAGDPSGVGGSWYSGLPVVGFGSWYYAGWVGNYTFEAGRTYVFRVHVTGSALGLDQITIGAGYTPGVGWSGTDFTRAEEGTIVLGWQCLEWTPAATTDQVYFHHQKNGSGTFAVDGLQAYTGSAFSGAGILEGHPDLVGESDRATRCDHRHDVHRNRAPTVDDDWDTAGYKLGTTWAQLDSLTAPTAVVGLWILVDNSVGAAVWLDIRGLSETEVQALIDAHAAEADPHTVYQKESEKAQANGYASLDGTTKVPIAQLPTGTSGTTVALGDHTHSAADDVAVWMPLTTVVGGVPELVWDSDDSLIPTLVPI